MTRRRFVFAWASALCLSAAGFVLAAPDKKPAPSPERSTNPLVITEADRGKTLQTRVGSAIEVRLVGDVEGAGWEAGGISGAVERKGAQPGDRNASQEPEFTPAKGAKDPSVGTYLFRHRAAAIGKSKMGFTYVSPGGPFPIKRSATLFIRDLKVTVEVTP